MAGCCIYGRSFSIRKIGNEDCMLKQKQKSRVIIRFILFLFCILPLVSYCEPNLKIHFIDVGEGDSILIQTPQGKCLLIDAGNLISGLKVVEYLKKNDIDRLDYLIFTHSHLDHIGGAFFVSQMIDIKKIYDNGENLSTLLESNDALRWYNQLVRTNSAYSSLRAPYEFKVDEVIFKVLWPHYPFIFSDPNSNSLVIMVEYGKFSALLTGDLTAVAEKELLNKEVGLTADILKVGHHGADDASSQEFLKAVSPKASVISAGGNNIWGYPSYRVLEELKNVNSAIYQTGSCGNIAVIVDSSGGFIVHTEEVDCAIKQ